MQLKNEKKEKKESIIRDNLSQFKRSKVKIQNSKIKGNIDFVIHRKWDNKIKEELFIPLPVGNVDINYFTLKKHEKKT